MCYLLMVGSTGEILDHRSWEALQDRLALPLDKALATTTTRAAFPAEGLGLVGDAPRLLV
jgi:hypothetical protein